METEILRLLISIITPIAVIVGIGWYGLDRMEQRIKDDAQKAHDLIGQNIEGLRTEISGVRTEISDMRKEITDLSSRTGRIEGILEVMRDSQ